MFCDLHVSIKEPFGGGYKIVEFVLFMKHLHVLMSWPEDMDVIWIK